jgi:hypothetical protein
VSKTVSLFVTLGCLPYSDDRGIFRRLQGKAKTGHRGSGIERSNIISQGSESSKNCHSIWLAAPGPDFVQTIPLKLSNIEKCLIIGQGIKRYAAEQTAGLLTGNVNNSKPDRTASKSGGRKDQKVQFFLWFKLRISRCVSFAIPVDTFCFFMKLQLIKTKSSERLGMREVS